MISHLGKHGFSALVHLTSRPSFLFSIFVEFVFRSHIFPNSSGWLTHSFQMQQPSNQAEQSRLLPGGKYHFLSQFWKIKITQSLVGLIEVWSSILFTTNWLGLWCSYAVYILWDFSVSSLLKIRLASAPVKAFASKCAKEKSLMYSLKCIKSPVTCWILAPTSLSCETLTVSGTQRDL